MVVSTIFLIFTPKIGEDSHFDSYFWDGLKLSFSMTRYTAWGLQAICGMMGLSTLSWISARSWAIITLVGCSDSMWWTCPVALAQLLAGSACPVVVWRRLRVWNLFLVQPPHMTGERSSHGPSKVGEPKLDRLTDVIFLMLPSSSCPISIQFCCCGSRKHVWNQK